MPGKIGVADSFDLSARRKGGCDMCKMPTKTKMQNRQKNIQNRRKQDFTSWTIEKIYKLRIAAQQNVKFALFSGLCKKANPFRENCQKQG